MKTIKTLNDLNFKDKTVLLRADINSPVVKKKIKMSKRIKQAVKTIEQLKDKKARIVVLAHQGRPGKPDFLSLKQHSKMINKKTKIKFVNDVIGKKAVDNIKKLKKGDAILLDNVRKEKDEFSPGKNNKIVATLLPLIDIYVNDAFSVCHRNHTSIVSFAKKLPSCVGRIMEKELKAVKKINLKNCLYILGGAKPEDNIKLLDKNVIACGLFGQCCVIAKGKKLGKQNEFLENKINNFKSIIEKLKKKLKSNVKMPEDFAVEKKGKRVELNVDEFPSKYEIFDIGIKSQEKFVENIKKAKSVYMKGPAGYCEKEKFCKGTLRILKAVSNIKGFSLIGGGHLSEVIEKYKIGDNFSHVSLAGGALLSYIAGEKLPGIEALKKGGKNA